MFLELASFSGFTQSFQLRLMVFICTVFCRSEMLLKTLRRSLDYLDQVIQVTLFSSVVGFLHRAALILTKFQNKQQKKTRFKSTAGGADSPVAAIKPLHEKPYLKFLQYLKIIFKHRLKMCLKVLILNFLFN